MAVRTINWGDLRTMGTGILLLSVCFLFAGTIPAQEDVEFEVDSSAAARSSRLELEKQALVPDNPAMRDVLVEKEFYRRLPNYYGEVVTSDQRETIYRIQEDYFQAMEMLRLRMSLLKMERDLRILEVLNERQQQEVARLEALADKKKASKKQEATDSEDATSSENDAEAAP